MNIKLTGSSGISSSLTSSTSISGTVNNSNSTPQYTLPIASANILGGIKVGNNLTIDANGTLSATGGSGGSSNYNDLTNKPSINGVEVKGSMTTSSLLLNYNDLINLPTIPTVPTNVSAFTNDAGYLTQHQDISGKVNRSELATVATSGSYNDLSNKPTIPEAYTLPTATTSTLGGVKVDGSSITITDGVISASGGGSGEEAFKITFTKGDEGYISDKTNAEIYTAYTSGKRVYLHMSYENVMLQAISITSTSAQFGALYGYNNNQEVWTDVISIDNNVITADIYTLVTTGNLNEYRTASAQNMIDATKANIADLSTVATSGSYNDLSNKPTIPTVNSGVLTIQKNGTEITTFSANSSSNVTANITVPTNNNELTNGAGYQTATDVNTIISGKFSFNSSTGRLDITI